MISPLTGFVGIQAPPEIVRINDLAKVLIGIFRIGYLATNKIMQTRNAYPAAAFVRIIVVVTYVEKIITVIEHPNTGKFCTS